MKICIDAGHNISGFDTGAEGNGLKEQNITFPIADKLRVLLEKQGIGVVMTRPSLESNADNSSLNASLSKRAEISNYNKCDYFVSIHCNAGGGTGTETYAFSEAGEGFLLAKAVNKAITSVLPLRDRGVKTANFGVLRMTNCPAILVETAFIDNYSDSLFLKNNQDDFARAISDGIFEYLGVKAVTSIADMKAYIAKKCGFSNPEDVFRILDTHPYSADLYKKWFDSYK